MWSNAKSKFFKVSVRVLGRNTRFCTKTLRPLAQWPSLRTVGSALTIGAIAYCSLFARQRLALNDAKDDLSAWHNRWISGNIAFHMSEINPVLVKFLGALMEDSISSPDFPKRVLVPLCGKTMDMIFLQNLGHKVLRNEICHLVDPPFIVLVLPSSLSSFSTRS